MPHKDIQEHMEVVGADDLHVGTVDSVEGEHIKLTRTDPEAGGIHHRIPLVWVEEVVDSKVHLSLDSEDAMEQWEPADA
ncbi:DUF2171 domain-containing protein [Rhodoplanes roseus]|uniref:DUF2171 domain-containing protein n=1 Tax=Rhodoplanes roseus TaxID=29409 RepID=A0A327KK06_9BRAD|nr:DUF2171 domain-containing protein [Rhodoplanes roseus]RAI39049.1 hypothetical protein CH341_26690 [Rhodoplanes roseus]